MAAMVMSFLMTADSLCGQGVECLLGLGLMARRMNSFCTGGGSTTVGLSRPPLVDSLTLPPAADGIFSLLAFRNSFTWFKRIIKVS